MENRLINKFMIREIWYCIQDNIYEPKWYSPRSDITSRNQTKSHVIRVCRVVVVTACSAKHVRSLRVVFFDLKTCEERASSDGTTVDELIVLRGAR
jgi:hypothetical protein